MADKLTAIKRTDSRSQKINIANNLRRLYAQGYDREQALAIALGIEYGFTDGRRRKVSGRWVGGE